MEWSGDVFNDEGHLRRKRFTVCMLYLDLTMFFSKLSFI
jgi:hypothetical protein